MRNYTEVIQMEPSSRKHHSLKMECLCQAKRVKDNDLFSRLPDELIVTHILSRFSLEEASQYKLLSRRWKKLWAGIIGSKLIFAPEHLQYSNMINTINDIDGLSSSLVSIDDRIDRLMACFECWISSVVQAYDRPRLDELTVRFPFGSSNLKAVNMWVDCAFKKGVSRLELNFLPRGQIKPCRYYFFPEIDKFQGMLANYDGLYNLRDVELKSVIVSAQVIEFMLARFPLERLCIRNLVVGKLSVSGVTLKSLTLDECKHLKISASNLTSLTYAGPENSVFFEHVPNLSELSVNMNFCATFLPTGFLNRGYISRLKRLELAMPRQAVLESVNYPLEFPETLNLEELKIDIYGEQEACCLWPVVLIKAAPFLRKFSVKVRSYLSESLGQTYDVATQRIRCAANTVRGHQYLKTIDLFGYLGDPNELELAQLLFRVSDVLEKVIVSPRYSDPQMLSEINNRAQTLAAWLPPKAKLTVLKISFC